MANTKLTFGTAQSSSPGRQLPQTSPGRKLFQLMSASPQPHCVLLRTVLNWKDFDAGIKGELDETPQTQRQDNTHINRFTFSLEPLFGLPPRSATNRLGGSGEGWRTQTLTGCVLLAARKFIYLYLYRFLSCGSP